MVPSAAVSPQFPTFVKTARTMLFALGIAAVIPGFLPQNPNTVRAR
jgi:hypothetical protein